MRRTPRSFSRFSTRDTYITLSCAMEDEPAFKPLQGNPTLLRVKASQYPLYLRQQTQGPSHLPIAEGRVHLRCLWKFGLLLQQNPGICSFLEMIWCPWSFPRVPVLKLVFLQVLERYIRESLQLPKVRGATCLVGWGMGDCTRSNTGESTVFSN